jgi:ParB family transcriptional regulator, chromosome partitioning protein
MALGKSLGNILGDYFGDTNGSLHLMDGDKLSDIEIVKIKITENQTREYFDDEKIQALAKSILEVGLINPVTVIQKEEGFIIISGERRFLAYKSLGKETIPAIIKDPKNLSKEKQAMITAMENLFREDLSPLEQAKTYSMIMKVNQLNENELAEKLGFSSQYVRNYLRLLTTGPKLQKALLEKLITEGQARHLVPLSTEDQNKILAIIIDKELTVKEIEKLVMNLKPKVYNKVESYTIPDKINTKLQDFLRILPKNCKVDYYGTEQKGRISLKWG